MAGSRGHLRITPVVAQTSEAVAGLASSLMCECSAVRLTPRLDGDRMSTEVMSVDDLVDLFPQYPRSAVEDVLQRVGPAQAVETLLTFSDDVLVSRLPAISIIQIRTCGEIRPYAHPQPAKSGSTHRGPCWVRMCNAVPVFAVVAPLGVGICIMHSRSNKPEATSILHIFEAALPQW